MARQLVARVVREILEKLAREVSRAFSGTRRKQRLVPTGSYSQFAARESIRRNLRHYDPERGRRCWPGPGSITTPGRPWNAGR